MNELTGKFPNLTWMYFKYFEAFQKMRVNKVSASILNSFLKTSYYPWYKYPEKVNKILRYIKEVYIQKLEEYALNIPQEEEEITRN